VQEKHPGINFEVDDETLTSRFATVTRRAWTKSLMLSGGIHKAKIWPKFFFKDLSGPIMSNSGCFLVVKTSVKQFEKQLPVFHEISDYQNNARPELANFEFQYRIAG